MRLWWAQLISQFGERINQMALIGLIAERAPGSAWHLAKLLSFTIIPVFLVGPIAGVLVDRWDRRKTLFVCDLVRSALVLSIALFFVNWDSLIPIYIVVFLVFCFSRFYVPAKMSFIPDLVPKEKLLIANSMMTTTGMIAFVLGCAIGGFLVDWTGARGGFIWNAVTFLISGILISTIPHNFHLSMDPSRLVQSSREILKIQKSVWAEIKEGVQYLVRHKEIRFVINMLFMLLASAGAVYVVIIVFIQQSFNTLTKDLGILAVTMGIGLFSGAVIYGKWGSKFVWYQTIFFCLIAAGLVMSVFALIVHNYANITAAAALSLVLGLVTGPIFIASNMTVQLVSDNQMRGKVFSALEVVIHFAFMMAMLISSFFSQHIAPVWILVGVGAFLCLAGLFGLIRHKNGGYLEFSR